MNNFSAEDLKHMIDVSSILSLIAALFDKLPHIAALVAAGWVFLRFYDYLRYVRPKLIRDYDANKSDPTDI